MAEKVKRITYHVSRIAFFSLLIIFLSSCARSLYKRTYIISGTFVEVTSPSPEAGKIVYEEFKRLDKIFNFYDSASELTQLNKSQATPFKASKELIEVLTLAKEVFNMTEGSFDVSYGALYDFWKELIKEKKVSDFPSLEQINKIKELGGMQNVEVDPAKAQITIKKQGLKIDLGGIAKGYMVDKAALKLKEKGIDSALINAGGDIYCLGTNKGKPWKVGIKDPRSIEGIIQAQVLIDEAIATSGNYEQFFEYKNKKYSHLIDPRSGYPVENNILSVSVISKNCTTADSLATAFFALGLEGIKDFLSKIPSTMRIIVVTEDEKGKQIHFFK